MPEIIAPEFTETEDDAQDALALAERLARLLRREAPPPAGEPGPEAA